MEIKRDGTCFMKAHRLDVPQVLKLFASVLKLEDGKFFRV